MDASGSDGGGNQPPTMVLLARGELDRSNAHLLAEAFRRVGNLGITDVIVDLNDVDFIDAAAAEVLVRGSSAIARVRCVGASRPVKEVLDLVAQQGWVPERSRQDEPGKHRKPRRRGQSRCRAVVSEIAPPTIVSFNGATLAVGRRDRSVVLSVNGGLDIANVDEFTAALETIIEHTRMRLVIDLRDTEFVSVAAMRALCAAHRDARGGPYAIDIEAGPALRNALRVVYPSLFDGDQ